MNLALSAPRLARLTQIEKQEQHLLDPPEGRHVTGFRSQRWPASNRNGGPASIWNAWPASSESAVSRHVTMGEQIVARQHEIIARLERAGCDTSYAKRLLLQFEELQSLHVADRDRLEKALAEISK